MRFRSAIETEHFARTRAPRGEIRISCGTSLESLSGRAHDHRRRPARLLQGAPSCGSTRSSSSSRAYPDWRGKVTYLQITPSSRSEIPEYAADGVGLVRRGGRPHQRRLRRGGLDADPLRQQAHSRTALAGLYRSARVGLVTPLRDGMNLVAKEYIAAQNPDDPGVLILSRFAGAAHECKEPPARQSLRHRGGGRTRSTARWRCRWRAPRAARRCTASAAAQRHRPWAERFLATLTPPPRAEHVAAPDAPRPALGVPAHAAKAGIAPSSAARPAAPPRRRAPRAPHRAASRSASPSRAGGSRPAASRLPSCRPPAAPGPSPASARGPCS